MRKKIAAAAMGAALLAGGGVGCCLMAPSIATAADGSSSTSAQTPRVPRPARRPARAWSEPTPLKKLVDAGTINQSQADAVAKALEAGSTGRRDARTARPRPRGRPRPRSGSASRTSTPRCGPARRSPTWPRPRVSTWRRS